MLLTLLLLAGCVSNPPASAQEEKVTAQGPAQTSPTPSPGKAVAVLANGCFWCTEAIFTELKGVDKVEPGYTGGSVADPTYEQVCGGRTGHAEAIRITFDPKTISYHDLLAVFFATHDPTTLNRQGADVGTQYRSAIFYADDEQRRVAQAYIDQLDKAGVYSGKIVTSLEPLEAFYVAEEYHQGYAASHPNQPYIAAVATPKVEKLRTYFSDRLKRDKSRVTSG